MNHQNSFAQRNFSPRASALFVRLVSDAGLAEAPEPAGVAGSVVLEVTNTAAVPISVTSHFHFFEANPRLRFDRAAAYGMHLAVAAGAAVRFEPGGTRQIENVPTGLLTYSVVSRIWGERIAKSRLPPNPT